MDRGNHPDYSQALTVALQAAQEAGALLRTELHRPGGPRGHGGHAPSDEAAETLIRERLKSAFPNDSILGEELGRWSSLDDSPLRHLWLVDPNDGTASFVKGRRGAAVSIALLRQGIPVLGVVYAYAYPDDEGDWVAWAENCGPLRRNGQPVQRPPWATTLTARQVVALSQDGDQCPKENALRVAPCRFRCLTGIAYRLAMAAAGEVEAGLSLFAPMSWDFAAGHALLRAVGGELLDERGQPVTYSERGDAHPQRVFGGNPAQVRELWQRDWDDYWSAAPTENLEYPQATYTRGKLIADTGLLQRAQGCLLGQLAGDSLGSLVEFQRAADIARQYPAGVRELADGGTWNLLGGQPTDDSELALLLARSLVREGHFEEEAVATAYAWWLGTQPFDAGTTTRASLSAGLSARQKRQSVAPACRAAALTASQANGALMRISPLGIWGQAMSPGELAGLARRDAALTHPHPVCQDASAVMAVTLAHAIHHGPSPMAVYEFALRWSADAGIHEQIQASLRTAGDQAPGDFAVHQGWVLIAMQNAFYQLTHAASLTEGLVDTVMRGGDTDTNACIAGALLGAVHGRSALPAPWVDRLLTCRPIRGLPGVANPRPQSLWPVDALALAERLLRP